MIDDTRSRAGAQSRVRPERRATRWLSREMAIGRRIARHKRIRANGLAGPDDKASLRELAEQAVASHPIHKDP